MFKLIKILNSPSNVPNFTELETQPDTYYDKGAVYYYTNGILHNDINYIEGEHLYFVSVEDKEEDMYSQKIKGFFVTHDMIFETVAPPEKRLYVGKRYNLNFDGYPGAYSVSDVEGDQVIVMKVTSSTTPHTLQVMFNI